MSSTWLDSRYPDINPGDVIVFKRDTYRWPYYEKDLQPRSSHCYPNDLEVQHPSGVRFLYIGRDLDQKVWIYSPVMEKPVSVGVRCFDHGYMINP